MAITSQPELYARAKLAEVARVQRLVDRTAWMSPDERRNPAAVWRLRRCIGLAAIRLGTALAGVSDASLGAGSVPCPSEARHPV
jgi:hypothetical protein